MKHFRMKTLVVSVIGALALFAEQQVFATPFDILNGQTRGAQTLANGDTGTVETGGAISVATTAIGVSITGSATLVNNGTISQTGTGRGIRVNVAGFTIKLINNVGGVIEADNDDVFQMNKNSNIEVDNYGLIDSINPTAIGGQALDFNAITTSSNIIRNFSTGSILAREADAIRPGVNGFVFNDGIIKSVNAPLSTSGSDGIDAQTNTGITIVNATTGTDSTPGTGLIEGARHGITGGADPAGTGAFTMNITNNNGGTIQGDNGSGVNIDGTNALEVVTIVNHGTITGNGVTGDGDGVDVDGIVNLTNTGTIRSIQSFNDTSEGVTVGGGTITNSGTIEGDNVNGGVGRGITLAGVDKDPAGNPIPTQGIYANTTIVNSGLIRGQSDSAIAVTGAANAMTVSITNLAGGILEGGGATAAAVFAGGNAMTLIDFGTITADSSGKAVDLGSGNSSLQIYGGAATINGDISGGTGTSSLTIQPGAGNSFSYAGVISNFASVDVGSGLTTLNGANTYSGSTTIDAGGTLVVGDAAHPNASIGTGLTTIAAGAVLGGYGTVNGSVVNNGSVAVGNTLPSLAAGGAGTLRITGNYTGVNAQLFMGAPTQTPQLIIGGNASGTTTIHVQGVASGAAAGGDGIELVHVNGTSAANSFRLSNPVQGGAFQYMLYQGASTPDASDFFLRSSFDASGASGAAYRPGTVGYSMMPLLNIDYGFTTLGQLHDRVNDSSSLDDPHVGNDNGVWGRTGGKSFNANSSDRFSADEQAFFVQFGKDWTIARGESGGSTHAGVTVDLGSASTSFDDSLRSTMPQMSSLAGTAETHAQSIGGYWTRYLPDGSYLDVSTQVSHYQNKYGDIFGDTANQNGYGAGVSGEVGKPFPIGAGGFMIEPQAQLMYQYLHLSEFTDNVSPVSGTATNALRGRVGMRLFHTNPDSASKVAVATPFLTADVLHDFLSPGQTSVGDTSFDDGLSKTSFEIGGGVSATNGKSSTIYANLKYARNVGGEYRQDVLGQVGYKYSW
jgi:outer membrane autotransporter protein